MSQPILKGILRPPVDVEAATAAETVATLYLKARQDGAVTCQLNQK